MLVNAWSWRPAFLPSIPEIVAAYPGLMDQGLIDQLLVSITTNLQAIAITCALTIPLAYLTVMPALRDPFVRALSKGRFLGITGFVVFFTLVFGGRACAQGGPARLRARGLPHHEPLRRRGSHPTWRSSITPRTLRLGPWGSVLEVVVLGHLDAVIDAIRQNAAMGWVMLTMVEGLVRFEGGLGSMMLAEDKHIKLDAVFAIQAVVLAIGIIQDWGFVGLKRLFCPYAALTLERQ